MWGMSTVAQRLTHLQFCLKTVPHTCNLNAPQRQNPYKYKDLGILAILKRVGEAWILCSLKYKLRCLQPFCKYRTVVSIHTCICSGEENTVWSPKSINGCGGWVTATLAPIGLPGGPPTPIPTKPRGPVQKSILSGHAWWPLCTLFLLKGDLRESQFFS